MTKEAGFANTLAKLKESISAYDHIVSAIDHELKTDVPDETDFFEDKLDHASKVLDRIKSLKAELDEIQRSSHTQQKIRICEEDERPLRLGIVCLLVVLLALAVFSTYKLNKIVDYKVILMQNS